MKIYPLLGTRLGLKGEVLPAKIYSYIRSNQPLKKDIQLKLISNIYGENLNKLLVIPRKRFQLDPKFTLNNCNPFDGTIFFSSEEKLKDFMITAFREETLREFKRLQKLVDSLHVPIK